MSFTLEAQSFAKATETDISVTIVLWAAKICQEARYVCHFPLFPEVFLFTQLNKEMCWTACLCFDLV